MNGASAVRIGTPDGTFTLLLRDGSVLASGWTADIPSLVALVHPALRPDLGDVQERDATGRGRDLVPAIDAVTAYYDGDHGAPQRFPVRQQSGSFRMQAWDALRRVLPGERITYTEYAARSGHPLAVRAAAAACALNAAALFVPCHRVLRTGGGLGGFRYGLAVKERLLEREAPAGMRPTLF
jgi:methylated-DNA-[protein]-cysteine S-methyltransferase